MIDQQLDDFGHQIVIQPVYNLSQASQHLSQPAATSPGSLLNSIQLLGKPQFSRITNQQIIKSSFKELEKMNDKLQPSQIGKQSKVHDYIPYS